MLEEKKNYPGLWLFIGKLGFIQSIENIKKSNLYEGLICYCKTQQDEQHVNEC